MILGAGASIAAPTRIPAFESMRNAILKELGWTSTDDQSSTYEHHQPIRGRTLPPLRSARLSTRAAPPEVVFGTLHRFDIPFAPQVEDSLREWACGYNAVHKAAAETLARGGPVWTSNVDLEIERAYAEVTGRLPRRLIVGERDAAGERLPIDVGVVDASTLLKFHGSVDARGSLAFTDLELLAPYAEDEIRHLAALARTRQVVVYGYAGADTDLRDLIAATIAEADEVLWYEPMLTARQRILRTFAGLPITFHPDPLPNGGRNRDDCVAATAMAFMAAADDHDLLGSAPPALRVELPLARVPIEMPFSFDPPAIVHARLVERFGRTEDEDEALAVARRADLMRVPPRAIRRHLRWTASRSLYRENGRLERVVRMVVRHPRSIRLLPRRLATYVYDKGPAVLLPTGEYESMHGLVGRALEAPGRDDPLRKGSDLYYLAHSLRYLHQPAQAADALASASRLLLDRRGRSDTERYAGVLLEQGIIAIHQGRITDAFTAANELVNGPGRYAIGRWSGWGHWLWAMAHLYATAFPDRHADVETAIDEAMALADKAADDFEDSNLHRAAGDVFIARLLGHRLKIAIGLDAPGPTEPPMLTRRQSNDVALLRADTALAVGDVAAADKHLAIVERSPANQVAAAWARLGRAEHGRHTGATTTAHDAIEHDAEERGARWLAAQAALGHTDDAEVTISTSLSPLRVRGVGEPRVLWLVT